MVGRGSLPDAIRRRAAVSVKLDCKTFYLFSPAVLAPYRGEALVIYF